MAEEAGKSARWLASHGLPGAEAIADMLSDGAQCCRRTGRPCALARGVALADRATLIDAQPIAIDTTAQPLLILAQMGRAADALGQAFALEWETGGATLAPQSLSIRGQLTPSAMTYTAIDPGADGTAPLAHSRPVKDARWTALTALSHRILVPASDASRAGAGAGTHDSD